MCHRFVLAFTNPSSQSTLRALLDEYRHYNTHLFPLHSMGVLPSTEAGLGLLVLLGDLESKYAWDISMLAFWEGLQQV